MRIVIILLLIHYIICGKSGVNKFRLAFSDKLSYLTLNCHVGLFAIYSCVIIICIFHLRVCV